MSKEVFFFILFSWSCSLVNSMYCYHCISPDHHLNPIIRRHLKTQYDVFFWQHGTQWNACSRSVDSENPTIEMQICSQYDLCVTLQPNINGSTFIIRGCLENIMRSIWRTDERIHNKGCYLIRSQPEFPNSEIVDYIVCVCNGDYCNSEQPVAYIPGIPDISKETFLYLTSSEDAEGKQYQVSTSAIVKIFIVLYCAIMF